MLISWLESVVVGTLRRLPRVVARECVVGKRLSVLSDDKAPASPYGRRHSTILHPERVHRIH